ncbi:MAG: coproporphyrinogen dehydrogenase HemZ [Oscillospiraceae bacterium]
MEIVIKGLPSGYEVEHVARIFYPGLPLRQKPATKGEIIYARIHRRRAAVGIRAGGRLLVQRAAVPAGQLPKLTLSALLYRLLKQATGQHPPWGMLTGVRPVRLLRREAEAAGEMAAHKKLVQGYDVSEEKYSLAHTIAGLQQPFVAGAKAGHYSLYVSIPFCPSRCAYCSFVSRSIERDAALVEAYLERLSQELAATARLAAACGLALQTIYIGGGTPTSLSTAQLARLLEAVRQNFDTAAVAEYTVEAGRADCTPYEKLALLKEYGVGRISINPQTMSNEVLAAIGRRHTAQQVEECFANARRAGHTCINMDIIAGLPKDTLPGFVDTLRQVQALKPENITLHTLTLKRASNLVIDHAPEAATSPSAMVAAAYPLLREKGYAPYYLYRQKSTVENLENTGWALPGQEGMYNIAIMEEIHTILAVGAGGSTKLVNNQLGKIERIFNHKYPADYLANFETVIAKKQGVIDFYAGNMGS